VVPWHRPPTRGAGAHARTWQPTDDRQRDDPRHSHIFERARNDLYVEPPWCSERYTTSERAADHREESWRLAVDFSWLVIDRRHKGPTIVDWLHRDG
jgi:hypothetical protein